MCVVGIKKGNRLQQKKHKKSGEEKCLNVFFEKGIETRPVDQNFCQEYGYNTYTANGPQRKDEASEENKVEGVYK